MSHENELTNGVIQIKPLDPKNGFPASEDTPLASATVGEYWQWAFSDVFDNTRRGSLAEFIVAKSLRVAASTQDHWAPYDLETNDGVKVEVKSSAYLQSWNQRNPQSPRFGIGRTSAWSPETDEFAEEKRRQSDVYVFCLLAYQGDKRFLNPLDISQWEFYVVATARIDDKFGDRKQIALDRVKELSRSYSVQEMAIAVTEAVR